MMLETIRHQSKGDLVKVAQYLSGYASRNEASGDFDANFVAHVCSWQSQHGLAADGVIGSNTWTKMASTAPTCSTGKNKTSAYTCAVQILVGGLVVDGIYGPNTKRGVSAFQAASGLAADGICGPKTWAMLITGGAAQSNSSSSPTQQQTVVNGKVLNKCVHYLQWDSRWKNVKYSTHTSAQTIGNSGCGPTSMAMIMATFIDPSITPVEICKISVDHGYRTYDDGTSWGLFKFIYDHYSEFSQYIATDSVNTLKNGLAQGALAVCSMNSNDNGFWTKGGHFIVAIGYDSDGYIYANDPNSNTVPRKQKENKFKSCMKQAFLFWPQQVVEPVPETDLDKLIDYSNNNTDAASVKSIIDISKWQGDIDFDKLKNQVSLVIARASCGSDKDIKIDEYAKAMNDRGIPFGVYCYSYAGTEAKAKDEAQKLVQYASKYNPKFYVMDAEESKLTNATIKAFAQELRALGIEKIGCYVAHNHYKDYGYDSLRSLFNFTWIPRYGKNDGTIDGSTKPAYVCDLWQYTSTGRIDGINGNVDMNVITGQGKPLAWFIDGKETPVDDKTAPDKTDGNVEIFGGNVNVRTAPNTSGKIIGVAYNGDVLEYGGKINPDNGWISVKFLGQTAWVSNKYSRLI